MERTREEATEALHVRKEVAILPQSSASFFGSFASQFTTLEVY
jgi:hypothetical protein